MPGVEELDPRRLIYRVTTRVDTHNYSREVQLTLRLIEPILHARRVFTPLIQRFAAGEDYRSRPISRSDAGRIRNELRICCPGSVAALPGGASAISIDCIMNEQLPPEIASGIIEALRWLRSQYPKYFSWVLDDGKCI
jgi:hypothetical protein